MARQAITKSKRNIGATRPRRRQKRASKPVRANAESALSASVAPASAQFNTTQVRFHFATLLRVSDNLVAKAVAVYDRLFALDQRDETDIYLKMGKDLVREHKFDEALQALRKVLASRPEHPEALMEVGSIHLRRGAPHAAAEMLEKAKAAGKRTHKLHLQLAEALLRQDQLDAALGELDAALVFKPAEHDAHYRRGVILDRMERYAEAVQSFQTAIELSPSEVRYHQSLGFTLETLGRRSDAIKCFKRALELERPIHEAGELAGE
jgi:tetratricopeptide (TPR) repeat protein